ncbi:hypothetical protein ACIP98_14410 [Streptomyces sp. NPDC088354]|uniref:hypothetical protein n=1 Tax=unclassified Streptomyces TaxID=2593676 RepID=UPI0029A71C8E|nr:hypothetical protein [Streptomyces sp. MI02-7b]MDX3070955.1 hypothetical protein [Streptomyces sp. MI02-7b]
MNDELRAVHERLARIEELLTNAPEGTAGEPAWRRRTRVEGRGAVSVAVLVAIVLQLVLPDRLAIHPRWLLPGLELLLLVALLPATPSRAREMGPLLRAGGLSLACAVSVANGWSAVRLIQHLVRGTEESDAQALLLGAASIWITNIIVFALWYWEWDRGGPVARAAGASDTPDFLFPQMQSPDPVHHEWEPAFADYLYVSFTDATAFSPTDTMPMTRWAKLLMAFQSIVSLLTLALVVARSVNILKA